MLKSGAGMGWWLGGAGEALPIMDYRLCSKRGTFFLSVGPVFVLGMELPHIRICCYSLIPNSSWLANPVSEQYKKW